MNNFCTFFNNLAKMDRNEIEKLSTNDLVCICNLASTVVKEDIGNKSIKLVTTWAINNNPTAPYVDIYFALRPYWLVGTPDDKQVKMQVTIYTEEPGNWGVHLVVDCENGEIESFGEKDFKHEELAPLAYCIGHMLNPVHEQYIKRMQEEKAKDFEELNQTTEIVKKQIEPLVEQIKKICKDNGLTLRIDRNLNSSECIYVTPASVEPNDNFDEGEKEIPEDSIPYIDLDIRPFDTNFDSFHKVK